MPLLVKALNDEDAAIRLAVAKSLGHVGIERSQGREKARNGLIARAKSEEDKWIR